MNYIIYNDKSFMHFFYSSKCGLCFKIKTNGRWSDSVSLYSDAKDGFCVFCDTDETVHIICSNKNNDILYIIKRNSHWHKFTLSEGTPEITPIEFKISRYENFLNFFYTAKYKDSIILVHCLLGANAKPETLDTMSKDSFSFSVNSGKVYYTNSDNILGFKDFKDGKPVHFNKICENAFMPYADTFHGCEYLLYTKNNFIFLNNNELFHDPYAITPIIICKDNKLTVQWKSNSFIRYITSFNNGATWSAPMRFISNGNENRRFCIHTDKNPHCYYGHNSKPEPIIYGKTNLFFFEEPKPENTYSENITTEYNHLIKKISVLNNEINSLRAKIKSLENNEK